MLKRVGDLLVNPSFIRRIFAEIVRVTEDEIKYSINIEFSNGDSMIATRGVIANIHKSRSLGLASFYEKRKFELEDSFMRREMDWEW